RSIVPTRTSSLSTSARETVFFTGAGTNWLSAVIGVPSKRVFNPRGKALPQQGRARHARWLNVATPSWHFAFPRAGRPVWRNPRELPDAGWRTEGQPRPVSER